MTLMRVAATNGAVLTYDTDDVENIEIETPCDVIDVTPPGATVYHRKLGQAHLVLRVDFKGDKRATWIDRAEAAEAADARFEALREETRQVVADAFDLPQSLTDAWREIKESS